MGRHLILGLLSSCIICATGFGQANVPHEASATAAAEYERLVGTVKNLPAHKLDRSLPATAFGDWLEAEMGPDTQVTWAVLADFDAPSPLDHVEVGIHAPDGRVLFINVAVGPSVHRPHVMSAFVWDRRYQQTDLRMGEVPSVLRAVRQRSGVPTESRPH